MKMDNCFTLPIVTCHLPVTCSLGQWYYTVNWISFMTPVVCGCSKCKGLKKNPRCVTLSHYINDRLPKVDGLIPPTVVKNPIGDIEKTHVGTLPYAPFLKIWKPDQLCFILNWPTHLLLLSQWRVLIVSQSMISILPKTSLLGDPKSCMS
jgi:hypothetical protein